VLGHRPRASPDACHRDASFRLPNSRRCSRDGRSYRDRKRAEEDLGNASELLNYSVVKHLPKRQAFFFRTLLLPTTLAVIAYTLPHGAGLYYELSRPCVAKKRSARAVQLDVHYLILICSTRSSTNLCSNSTMWDGVPHDSDRAGRPVPSQQTLDFSDSDCRALCADIGPDTCGSGTSMASLKSTRHGTWDFRAASGHA
jgi:hypothetical protein